MAGNGPSATKCVPLCVHGNKPSTAFTKPTATPAFLFFFLGAAVESLNGLRLEPILSAVCQGE